ncbi:uncharacterized protein [Drosophila tropicalis]|uniref:uncharacterized protein n=1 Tax=Drosophila tropicalis TaxID=46794 RepID=UPI0035AB83AF
MAKLIPTCMLLLALVQWAYAGNPDEALNNHIREQIQGFETILAKDDGSHKVDLEKLIKLYESALRQDNYDEKQAIIKGVPQQFSSEFEAFIQLKLQEYQVNEDIVAAVEFYKTLLKKNEYKDEIEKTLATLEALQKEPEVEKRKAGLSNLDKSFSPEFLNFLKQDALPKLNHDIQSAVDFFDNLLKEANVQFVDDIKALKAQAEHALGADVSIDDKQKALNEVTNPPNQELTQYLQKKFIENQ